MADSTALFNLDDLDLLASWDTPTICNALELLMPEVPLTAYTTRPGVPWTVRSSQ